MAIRSLKSGSFSRSTQVGNSIILPGDYESIATATVGSGGASTVTFSSIPSTFKHLQLRSFVLFSGASTYGNLRFNSDTTAANYYAHGLTGTGAVVSASAYSSSAWSPWTTSGSSTYPYVEIMDILDYSSTNKYKTVRQLLGYDMNGTGNIALTSSLWSNTAAINRIDLTANSGNWTQYSHFALYGIRG